MMMCFNTRLPLQKLLMAVERAVWVLLHSLRLYWQTGCYTSRRSRRRG